MICDRCHKETGMSTGSYFNTEQICFACAEIERAHPDFQRAREVEMEQVRQGNFNYQGVGLPADLRRNA